MKYIVKKSMSCTFFLGGVSKIHGQKINNLINEGNM